MFKRKKNKETVTLEELSETKEEKINWSEKFDEFPPWRFFTMKEMYGKELPADWEFVARQTKNGWDIYEINTPYFKIRYGVTPSIYVSRFKGSGDFVLYIDMPSETLREVNEELQIIYDTLKLYMDKLNEQMVKEEYLKVKRTIEAWKRK